MAQDTFCPIVDCRLYLSLENSLNYSSSSHCHHCYVSLIPLQGPVSKKKHHRPPPQLLHLLPLLRPRLRSRPFSPRSRLRDLDEETAGPRKTWIIWTHVCFKRYFPKITKTKKSTFQNKVSNGFDTVPSHLRNSTMKPSPKLPTFLLIDLWIWTDLSISIDPSAMWSVVENFGCLSEHWKKRHRSTKNLSCFKCLR